MGEIVRASRGDSEGLPAMPPPAAAPMSAPAPQDEGIDPRRLIEALYRRRRILIVTMLVAALAAGGGALTLPRTFTARTSVLVLPDSDPGYLGSRSAGSGPVESHVDLLREFVQSRAFMQPTLQRLGYLDEGEDPDRVGAAVRGIQAGVRARPLGAAAFEVTYTGRDPAWPLRIVDAVVSSFIDVSTRARASQAEQAAEFLENQLAEYRKRAADAQAAVDRFQREHATTLAQAPESTSSRLARVEDGLIEARMSQMDAEMRINLISRQIESTPQTVVSERSRVPNPRVLAFQSELARAEAQLAALQARYTDQHPEVRAKMREVEDLRGRYNDATSQPTTSGAETTRVNPAYERLKDDLLTAQNQAAAARARVAEFGGLMNPARSAATTVPVVRQQWEVLQMRARTQEGLYNTLVERLEQARLASEMDIRRSRSIYQLIDAPRLLPSADGKKRLGILIGGLGAGLLLGLTLVGLQEMTDRRVRSAEELERSLGLPVLASIPLLPEMPYEVQVRRSRQLLAVKIAVAAALVALLFVLGARTNAGRDFIRERAPAPAAATAGSAATTVPAPAAPQNR
ncbi:MAG: hypothetical protein HY321_22455 [Armatimonadetes bacterium]|nr:hypothetical protein [Armatimonadota bacterium]